MSFLLEFKKPSNEPHHVNPLKDNSFCYHKLISNYRHIVLFIIIHSKAFKSTYNIIFNQYLLLSKSMEIFHSIVPF